MREELEKVRAACIKANPEKDWDVEKRTDGMWKANYGLADVLSAIHENIKDKKDEYGESLTLEITSFGLFIGSAYNWEETPLFWNLHETLDDQDEPTIHFLATLLEEKSV